MGFTEFCTATKCHASRGTLEGSICHTKSTARGSGTPGRLSAPEHVAHQLLLTSDCAWYTQVLQSKFLAAVCALPMHTFGSPWQNGHPDRTPLVSELHRVDPIPHGYMDYNKLQLDIPLVSILLT